MEIDGLRLVAQRVQGRRIGRVRIERTVPAGLPADDRATDLSGAQRLRRRHRPAQRGKSTLVNTLVGTKVSITSARPNTTRFRVRGVLNRPDVQIVFVDTPGLHRPKTALGERLNETAGASLDDVDVIVVLVDATAAVGPGDRMVLGRAIGAMGRLVDPPPLLVAVNKTDAGPARAGGRTAGHGGRRRRAARPGERPAAAGRRPSTSSTSRSRRSRGDGVDALVEAVVARLPDGPAYYPEGMVSDTPEAVRVAELVREQLLIRARDELPHSIACRVTEWEGPYIRCEILVERDSQKGIVIGAGGEILKAVGSAVRAELEPGTYLDLFVRVEKRWQQRDEALDKLGY